jgi:hypothetical protein
MQTFAKAGLNININSGTPAMQNRFASNSKTTFLETYKLHSDLGPHQSDRPIGFPEIGHQYGIDA